MIEFPHVHASVVEELGGSRASRVIREVAEERCDIQQLAYRLNAMWENLALDSGDDEEFDD